MSTTPQNIRKLRRLCHHLKPVVLIGQHGLSDTVLEEIECALAHHELIKIRIAGAERDARKQMTLEICEKSQAELVQMIGNISAIYRKNPNKNKKPEVVKGTKSAKSIKKAKEARSEARDIKHKFSSNKER